MNQLIRNMVDYRLIRFQDLKLKIVVVLFFFTAPSQLILFFKFDPTLSAHNYAPKTPNLKNYHIFGKLRTSAFTSLLVRSEIRDPPGNFQETLKFPGALEISRGPGFFQVLEIFRPP